MSTPQVTISLGGNTSGTNVVVAPMPQAKAVSVTPLGASAVVTSEPVSPPIVVKDSEPTAADYGLAVIPVNAVWIYKP